MPINYLLMGMSALSALVTTLALPGLLQLGYFAGLLLSCAWSRANLLHVARAGVAGDRPSHRS
jgi:hypothetical protein